MWYKVVFIISIATKVQGIPPQAVAGTDQPTDEPAEGINISPSTSRPWVLWTHDQHVADYVCIMVELGMSLPMTED